MSEPRKYLTSPGVPYPHMGALLAKRIREKGFRNSDIVKNMQKAHRFRQAFCGISER
jgi:hypothetical protein